MEENPSASPAGRHAFTLLEVMIATMILAVGISTALNAILSNNNFRRALDENAMAELVLRQMSARLKTANIADLGHVTESASGAALGWTLHLRATASTSVPAAVTTAPALRQPYSTATYSPPFRPLSQQDLIEAAVLREAVPLNNLQLYIEYYNLSTIVGLQNSGGALVPVENGLIKRFTELQDANPSGSSRTLWYTLVGDPAPGNRAPPAPLSPSDAQSNDIIMPATFSLANVDQPGTPEQVRGAFNHGLAIRILLSWQPIETPSTSARQWRETIIVKRE